MFKFFKSLMPYSFGVTLFFFISVILFFMSIIIALVVIFLRIRAKKHLASKQRYNIDYSSVALSDTARKLFYQFFEMLNSRCFLKISAICSPRMINKIEGMTISGLYLPIIQSYSLINKTLLTFKYLFVSRDNDSLLVRRTVMEFCCIDNNILIDNAEDE